ncbi:MAG: DUF1800 family protein [Deltaproteobacteria bacterium]|nr:DUF1800 family protein [Deltaproteobacteria bacterium]
MPRFQPTFARSLAFLLTAMLLLTGPHSVFGAVTITLSPSTSVTVPVNGIQQFTATVAGTPTTGVTWLLIPPAGVSASVIGKISVGGRYTAPSKPLPSFASLTVKATSMADPTVSTTNTITVRYAIPTVSSVVPNSVPLGPFTLTVNGKKFVNGAQVLWDGQPLTTTFVSSIKLTATGTAAQGGAHSITAANPGPDAVSTALTVTVVSNLSVTISPTTVSLAANGSQQFQVTVLGTANQNVTWSVVGGSGNGTITGTGLYTAPAIQPVGGTATVYAIAAADGVTQGSATVTIQASSTLSYARFLDQATFGPTPALLAHVQQVGMAGFLQEQFATPESPWPPLETVTRSQAIDAFFANARNGQDQLRQRVLGALSEIIVVASNKNTNANEVVPWLQLLSRNAFGNYRTLLKEITLDASMGKYLDLANSGVQGGAANENYPREVMQLFSLGLSLLNLDGSVQTDTNNTPLPTYTQTDVQQLAKALTGWTFTNASGTTSGGGNYNYYPGPMIPVPGKHNTSAKTVLGQSLPANQTAQQDLESVIDILFNHPNIGPFIATRFIRALVTSNPTPAYIARVAQVFNGGSGNARGDMQAVLTAILLDPEARNDTPASDFGRLRTPMQHTVAMTRALNIDPGPASQFSYLFYYMNEGLLDAPSVFGHYSPMYRIPKTTLFGPEFQIYSASDAVNRANFFYSLIYSPWPINPALQPFVNIASDASALVTAVDNTLLHGRMLPQTRTAILNSLPAMYDNNQRVMNALYLTFTSGEYLVQR